jgi:hypothetical protein
MPSRKRRRRTEEEPESIWAILAESLAEGVVRTFTNEANKLAEEFLARQQFAMGKKANNANPPEGEKANNANPPLKALPEPVVDNATTEKTDDNDDVIEGEYRYVD